MHPSVVIDTSVWISHIVPLDVSYRASKSRLTQYRASGGLLVAPEFLVIEVASAVARRTGQIPLAYGAVQNLHSANDITLIPTQSTLIEKAARIAADLRLRSGDSIYVALAHQLGIPLISWDKEQLARATALVETYSPDAYPF